MTTATHVQSPNVAYDRRAAQASSRSDSGAPSKLARRTSYALSGLALAFLLFDAVGKVLQIAPVQQGTTDLGYSAKVILPLGIVQLVCWALYALPRTAVLGAILWTGYLGGAIATHVRVEHPLFSHVLFPSYLALLLWGGLWLRSPALRAVLPLRRDTSA